MLAQDTQTRDLRYHRLEVRNHWLVALTIFVVGVLLVVGALFAWQSTTLTADESTARQSLAIVDSGSTTGLDDVYTWSATFVDYDGVAHQGIDAIRAFFAADQANGVQIPTIGHPTTIGNVVSTPFEWTATGGVGGDGILTTRFEGGKVVYATLVVEATP